MRIEDDELLGAAREGDEAALDLLIKRHLPAVQRFSMKMCGEVEDANDVSQDTFMTVARSLAQFRGDSSFPTWLYTIARSFCVKKRRRSKFVVREDSFETLAPDQLRKLAHPGPRPDEDLANQEMRAALDQAIAALEPKYREVLVLRDVEGLTAPQVAEVLALKINTVKTRLHRARAAVREYLEGVLANGRNTPADSGERCTKALRLFSRQLEGDLTPAQCARMAEHLAHCPTCDADCRVLKRALELCRTSRPDPVPAGVQKAIRRKVRALMTHSDSGSGIGSRSRKR